MPVIIMEKNKNLELIRVYGCIAVIVFHVAASSLTPPIGTKAWWTRIFFIVATKWCVPIFIMLSGALLLNPAKQDPLADFFYKRIRRIGIPILFWSVFYTLWELYTRDQILSLNTVVLSFYYGRPGGALRRTRADGFLKRQRSGY